MLTKSIVALAAFAAVAEQALAFNSHRHLHRRHHQLQKRDREVEVVTVWTTIYEVAPQETEAPPHRFLADSRPAQAQEPAVTSVAPPSAPVDSQANTVAKPPEEAALKPQAPQTTLATSAKPIVEAKIGSLSVGYGDAPAAPSAGPASGNSGAPVFPGKRGVAYNNAKLANSLSEQCDMCGWAYNWGSSPQGLDPKVNFVPTLWSDQPRFTNQWTKDADQAIQRGVKAMFSFNEPDNSGQANMTPQQAAAAHARLMNPYAGKALIGSPSVTNSGSPGQGIQWLKAFMSACDQQQDKCRVDFCNVHWYSPSQYEDTLYQHLKDAHDACRGKPIWLTEFAPVDATGQPAETPQFLQSVMPKLDKMDFVHAYAPFMCADGKLMSANQLSDTGKVFANAS